MNNNEQSMHALSDEELERLIRSIEQVTGSSAANEILDVFHDQKSDLYSEATLRSLERAILIRVQVSSYQHPSYPPGQWVRVSETLREIHPEVPAAGAIVQACEGALLTSNNPTLQRIFQAQEQKRSHLTYVPVVFGGNVWHIEEEYVSAVTGWVEIRDVGTQGEAMNSNGLKLAHELDQGLAESLELVNVIVGQDEQGQGLVQLTAKGVTRISILVTDSLIKKADEEKRDLTSQEKHEIVGYLLQAIEALQQA